jgi:hypothetical protein
MVDFTIETYISLIEALLKQGFSFQTFTDFIKDPNNRVIILRQDVDLLPENSLIFATIQAEKGIKATYYFRTVPQNYNEQIIKEIYSLGHEIGYHYENVGTTAQRHKGITAEKKIIEIAIESFKENLERLRKIVPVKTICMHGSPTSRWDSRLLWKYYDYHDFGIIGEPYFDINFNEVLYLTDTGRCWDGDSYNIRDKASGVRRQASGDNIKGKKVDEETGRKNNEDYRCLKYVDPVPSTQYRTPFPKFHSTFDIIRAAEQGKLPDKIMMTFHPQRWTDKPVPWVRELIWQNVKNVGKYFLVKVNSG